MSAAAEHDVAVALTFDFDALSAYIGTLGAKSPSMLSRGELSPIGVRRILALLDAFGAQATFFVPGHTACAFPRTVEAIAEAGHEIGHHGWVHENPLLLSREQERQVLERGSAELRRVTGEAPVGYRSPAWDNSPHTVELLLEHGFEYESSLMGGDFEPYWCRVGDRWSTTEPYEFGRPTELVEMPVAWHLDDVPYFEFIYTDRLYQPGLNPPSVVAEVWRGEFDYLYQRIKRGMIVYTMHPECIGRGHRMAMLEGLLEHMAGHPGTRFTTCRDYVRGWRAGRTPQLPVDAEPRLHEP